MKRWLTFADRIDRLNGHVGRLVSWLALLMVLVGAYNAVVRYLAGFSSIARDSAAGMDRILRAIGELALPLNSNMFIELQWYLFSIVFLLGAAYGLRCGTHVRVDVLYQRLSPRSRARIDILGAVLFLLPFCALMAIASWPFVAESWAVLEVSPDPGGLPRYPLLTVIPLAFLLLALQGIAQLIRSVLALRSPVAGGAPAQPYDQNHGL